MPAEALVALETDVIREFKTGHEHWLEIQDSDRQGCDPGERCRGNVEIPILLVEFFRTFFAFERI
jgi:hypothetical protein